MEKPVALPTSAGTNSQNALRWGASPLGRICTHSPGPAARRIEPGNTEIAWRIVAEPGYASELQEHWCPRQDSNLRHRL